MTIKNSSIVFLSMLALLLILAGCSQTGTVAETDTAVAGLEQNASDIVAAYSAHDVDKILSFMADDVEMIEEDGSITTGKEKMRENLEGLFKSFPDLVMEPVAIFGKGNRVCTQWHATGTASGANEGEEAMAGKKLSVPGATIAEWEEGKVVRSTVYVDMATIMNQLGLLPSPAPAEE